MGRAPCCAKVGLHKGQWTPREDTLLIKYIQSHGEGNWRSLPKKAGLLRCGKSCRLRWINYLKPGVKRGNITSDEEDLIIRLHTLLGNRWSLIAGRLPGRTDNEIKNYWNTYIQKRHRKTPEQEQEQEQESSLKKTKNKPPPPAAQVTKPKVYLPKAVRVRTTALMAAPKKDSFDQFSDSSDLFCGLEGGGEMGFFSNGLDINNMLGDGDMNLLFSDHFKETTTDIDVDASDEQTRVLGFLGVGGDNGDFDHDLVKDLGFECQFGSLPEEDQHMYEQYLQLLNNDNQDGDQVQLY